MPSASPFDQSPFSGDGDEASAFITLGIPQIHTPVEAATASICSSDDIDMADEAPRTYATLETQRRNMDHDSQMMFPSYFQDATEKIPLRKDVFLTSLCADSAPAESHWAQSLPEQWTIADVISWIYEIAEKYKIDHNRVYGENFNDIDGQKLCNMSLEDFQRRDRENGRRFYNCLQILRRDTCNVSSGIHACTMNESSPHIINLGFEPSSGSDSDTETILPSISHHQRHSFSSSSTCTLSGASSNCAPCSSEFNVTATLPLRDNSFDYTDYQVSDSDRVAVVRPLPTPQMHQYPASVSDYNVNVNVNNNANTMNPIPKRRGPGRPRKNPLDGPMSSKPKKKTENDDKILLWKFLRNLLLDKSCNPRIIKWEDQVNGIFRIVVSAEVSRLWGEQKKNNRMTYEKMSRAIRFCRDKLFFAEMPKEGNFPKKLCFKFGEKANGWI